MPPIVIALIVVGVGVLSWFWGGFLYRRVIYLPQGLKSDPAKLRRMRIAGSIFVMAAAAIGLIAGAAASHQGS